jgi:folate-binding Fe-S cluster repair protein YgfZ
MASLILYNLVVWRRLWHKIAWPIPCTALTFSPFYHLLHIAGADRINFLQGLVTQDVTTVTPDTVRFAAMLNPGGRFIADMLLLSDGDNLYLRVAASQSAAIQKRLTLYKLRSKVELALITDSFCQVSWSESAAVAATAFNLPAAWRLSLP